MVLLNIFQHSDGTFAWELLLIILLALTAGYFLNRFNAKKIANNKYASSIAEWESKYKKLENEYKNYKSNISSAERQNDKSVVQLGGRVKALEGDIRALSDEKNKSLQQLLLKEEEIKKYSKLVADQEDNIKAMREAKMRSDAEWAEKFRVTKDDLSKALIWEQRVRAAEDEAQKARSVVGTAERKKLEAELRLKAVSEFAGKVGPLESELQEKNKLISDLQQKLSSSLGDSSELNIAKAQLELQKDHNTTLKKELELKNTTHISLISEIDYLKKELVRLSEENVTLKSKVAAPESLS